MCVLPVRENTEKSAFLKNFKMITNENVPGLSVFRWIDAQISIQPIEITVLKN